MKKIEWATPNRMRIDTGLAVFDRQVGAISTGNVIGDTQISSYLRPFSETSCNGQAYPPGHLQESDLRGFGDLVDEAVRELVRRECAERQTILYFFFHHTRAGRRIVHGALLTSGQADGHREIARILGEHPASARVLAACAPYVSEPPRPVVGRDASLASALSRRPPAIAG